MTVRYVFVDETGNFDFSPRGSKYFILTSIVLDDCIIGEELAQLRRDLARRGTDLREGFHATEDRQAVRGEVFRLLARHNFRVDATIIEKAKAMPHLRTDDVGFYGSTWYSHLRSLIPQIAAAGDELLIVGATLSLKRRQRASHVAIAEAAGTAAGSVPFMTGIWTAASEPCLQVADYCCWAIQRKWERGDLRSDVLIQDKIASEFDVFRRVSTRYY